jgi:hypothetical protein
MYICASILWIYTVVVAQLVRASVCGTEGRGFEPHLPPNKKKALPKQSFFFLKFYIFKVN